MRQDDRLNDLSPVLADISASTFAKDLIRTSDPDAYDKLVIRGKGVAAMRSTLDTIQPGQLITQPVRDEGAAQAMLAGLWLWFDWLEPSHTISQSLENPTGSFWHAILHRREGDFSNSKYWYARAGRHPAFAEFGAQA